jgi:recombinational DNA repair protein RecR
MVPHIESDKGTVRKVSQYSNSYHVITTGIQNVKGWEPKLLFFSRTDELDKAFADGNIKPFAVLASEMIGGMK